MNFSLFTIARFRLGACLLFCVWSLPAWAASSARTALVIGNQRYEDSVGALKNTVNDAKAVAQTLRTLGFSVIERHDVNRDQFLRAVIEFRKTLPGSEVALFYYAGHGVSVAGENYLVPLKSGFDPVDADDITLRMLAETRLFNAEQAVADMSAAGATCNIVILDACRNTPIARDTRSRNLAGRAGLSEMTPPAGSLIAFATDAGRTALDGDGTNGLYTEELLKNLRTPGLTIEQVFKRTRAGVLHRSGGGQVPAEYSRLIGDDIYLAGFAVPERVAVSSPEPTPTPVPVATALPLPTIPTLTNLAANGEFEACLTGLHDLTEAKGPGEYTLPVLEALMERVKNDLKDGPIPAAVATSAVTTCDSIIGVLPECLPLDHPQALVIAAQAYNRRGDALVILGRTEEAIQAYDTAQPLAPDDSYILYNRGHAYLVLGNTESARADFTAALDPKFDQPKARKLAEDALAGMEPKPVN